MKLVSGTLAVHSSYTTNLSRLVRRLHGFFISNSVRVSGEWPIHADCPDLLGVVCSDIFRECLLLKTPGSSLISPVSHQILSSTPSSPSFCLTCRRNCILHSLARSYMTHSDSSLRTSRTARSCATTFSSSLFSHPLSALAAIARHSDSRGDRATSRSRRTLRLSSQ